MKQKYLILKNDDKKELIIQEFGELDKEKFSLLCEETYDDQAIRAAIQKGKERLISELRTQNMYPIGHYAGKIAGAVTSLYTVENKQSIELLFNDLDFLTKSQMIDTTVDEIEDKTSGIDELKLIEEDLDDDYEDKNVLDNLQSSIQVADDDSVEDKEAG